MKWLFWSLSLVAVLGFGAHPILAATIEDITFDSGQLALAGRLVVPDGAGPFPAIVFTHGSGDAGRDNSRYQLEAEYFSQHGIASFLYDKRGSGDSAGDWRQANFEQLADDALAAISFLKTRAEIDPQQIGLRGSSQSGWILPIAADRSSDVAHIILISPAGVTPYEQVVYDVRTDLEDAGFVGGDIDDGLALLRSALNYARTGDGWDLHAAALKAAEHQPWFSIASGPPVADHWLWSWMRPVMDFDVLPILRRISTPVLVILGDADRECPSQTAGHLHEQVLGQRDDGFHLVRYFRGADHGIRVAANRVGDEEPPLAEGYLETLRDWTLGIRDRRSNGQ